jgi:hypothetical protein
MSRAKRLSPGRYMAVLGSGLFLIAAGCARETKLGPAKGIEPAANLLHFVAASPEPGFALPQIVLQYDPVAKTGSDGAPALQFWDVTPPFIMSRAACYLREGLQRMTGRSFTIISTNDLSKGIVLTLLNGADASIRNDPDVQSALRADPKDVYASQEAYFIRSESNRLLIVANTPAGLASGVVELLESVEYEVLGMGPDWIHVPDYRNKPLAFAIRRSGRPSFYIRGLIATSGQCYGVGTIVSGLTDPADEPVTDSYWRWQIGARLFGTSMPGFPGHALQTYHIPVIDYMRTNNVTEGFLAPGTIITPEARRPAAAAGNNGWLWLDSKKTAACSSDGKTWVANDLNNIAFNLDLSMPFVREIIFRSLANMAEAAFEKEPDALVVFPMDAEDGAGYGSLDTLMKNKTWYPDYLAHSGAAFGKPYVLHGHNGLNQPVEIWDPAAASDTMFGFGNYLLREYDKWIDSLPAEKRITASGKSKKDRVRASFYSYNYHDVPPNFNVDPRVRVMIASYPKHRGQGKWEKFASQEDMARAFKVMLPREPSGDYRILTLSYYLDPGPANIPAAWSAAPAAIAADYRRAYDAGYRAINCETDFNFGRYGLAYYLIAKFLWNADLKPHELDLIRDRWFRRAFGGAWREMKVYYDFMLTDNYPVNGPNTWAQAIRLLDAADRKLNGAQEPAAQKRIDDCKQFWYHHYLMDTGLYTVASPEVREYLWKGQMSYMVALHVLCRRDFGKDSVLEALGPEGAKGPAHYTHAETQVWWAKILAHWTVTPVTEWTEAKLANGKPARSVDLNDLVRVREFQSEKSDAPFYWNSGFMKPVPFVTIARRKDDIVGFKLVWPFNPKDSYYIAKKLPYGVDIWNPGTKAWDAWVDKTMIVQPSVEITNAQGTAMQLVDVRLKAPRPGTYRFDLGYGGNASFLSSVAYDPVTQTYTNAAPFTYTTCAEGHTQSEVYFYIPKGVQSLDLEVWDAARGKQITFYKGLPDCKPEVSRRVDVTGMGTHRVALQAGEDGTVVSLYGDGFSFPFLYSVPTLWAKSPGALLVPRAVAEADGLTILL